MNKSKAEEIANNWLSQKPKTLEPNEVFSVLEALGFIMKREVKRDTTYIYTHSCLEKDSYFQFCSLYISINHGKGKKPSIVIGSVKPILKAISLHPDIKNE